ncbi:MAG: family 20 glycosylhydrolase [Chitinophagaceae bacterium]|nr:family 20 glycosylhydrolase [Chitinophagaceae bacterium]
MRSTALLLCCIFVTCLIIAQPATIIPRPVEVKPGTGSFSLSASTVIIVTNGVDDNSANFLNSYLKMYYGWSLRKIKTAAANYIRLTTLQTLLPGKEGAYSLTVEPGSISIQGQTASGTFYGMQTLIQLFPVEKTNSKLPVPSLMINDEPRFAYRGMHLDVSRHFFPVAFIKKYIDYLAVHKINTFHWHLTEDQGWRIEIKKYPKLTSVGAWRNGTIIGRYPGTGNDNKRYGGFYTQAEIKEVVKYAKDRFIDVVPEIEMPGHSSAAIAAYPWLSCFPSKPTPIPGNMISSKSADEQKKGRIKLVQETWGVFDDVFCAGNESTFQFLQNVIDEVIPLFPSKYFHVGGDECPKTHWKTCPKCQQRMKELGLKDEHELQSYFIQRIEKYLNRKGKTLIGWDEILEGGLAPNAIVMSWRGEQGGIDAAKQKHKVIMTPGNPVYFDHTQSLNEDSVTIGGYNPIEKVYAYEPIPAELDAEEGKYIMGAQANLWTEYIKNTRKVEYMVFPRMAALSEVLWSKKENRDLADFEKRLLQQFKRYELWKANYSLTFFDLKAAITPDTVSHGVLLTVNSKIPGENILFHNYPAMDSNCIDSRQRSATDTVCYVCLEKTPYTKRINCSGVYGYTLVGKNLNTSLVIQKFQLNKATGKPITIATEPSRNYPGDGAFTLVNGVQNEKGLARSREFLGWSGDDLEAVIDLGVSQFIGSVVIHSLSSGGSWIYPPESAEIFISQDGREFFPVGKSDQFEKTNGSNGVIRINPAPVSTRFIKVFVKNKGIIPDGNPGAGNKAWLFVDEIEVN